MGIKTSPSWLNKLMVKVLRGTEDFASCLMDDISIYSDTWDDHMKHIRMVLERLRAACLTANVSKCQFCLQSIKIMGYTLVDGNLMPSDDKIEAILKLGPAKTKKGVKSILGLSGYYRGMQPNFAETTYCLTQLLRKDQPEKVRWEQKHTDALETIKRNLVSKPILVGPKFDREFIVQTDATQQTVAGICSQLGDDGREHVIAYCSRKLLDREQKYSSIERECLAILFSLTKWEQLLYGQKIRVVTDHQPLRYLSGDLANNNARLVRWRLFLQSWDLVIQYRKGREHGNADSLSRLETE